jgi:hypothetical protein
MRRSSSHTMFQEAHVTPEIIMMFAGIFIIGMMFDLGTRPPE